MIRSSDWPSGLGETEDSLGGRVPENDGALRIAHHDGVAGTGDELAEIDIRVHKRAPAQPHAAVVRAVHLALGGLFGLRRRLGHLRHYLGAQLGVGGQYTMKADQMQPWPWHQRRQPLHEFQWRHDQVRCAVTPGRLQPQHDLSGGVGLHAFVGQSRAGDVAAQFLQRLAVVSAAAHGGVQAEAVDVGAQRLLEVRLPGHGAL